MIDKLKRIAEYFPYCLTIVDMESAGRLCVFANTKFLENTGYQAEEAIGRNLSYLQGELTSEETVKFMRKCFDEGSCCIQDLVNYKKDGTPFLNRLLMLPFKTPGEKLFYIGFQNDITEKKGLSQNNASLAKVNDGEIKHMVNNPLSIILGGMTMTLKQSHNEVEIAKTAKSLSSAFERINNYALKIENVSSFQNFDPKKLGIMK
jgi:PAS domain S-box-containing protein